MHQYAVTVFDVWGQRPLVGAEGHEEGARESLMPRLSCTERSHLVRLLMEGMSIASVVRSMNRGTSVTVHRFRRDFSAYCRGLHDEWVRDLYPKTIQCDECWTKLPLSRWKRPENEPNVRAAWVWLAIDQDSRLLVSWRVGLRDDATAESFLQDLRGRCEGGYDLVTDGCFVYPRVVEKVFVGTGVCHHVLNTSFNRDMRYSSHAHRKNGKTTNHVERLNSQLRTRLAPMHRHIHGYAQSFATLNESLAIYAIYYNFVQAQTGLKVTPAIEAGLLNRLWSIEEVVDAFHLNEPRLTRPGPRAAWTKERRDKFLATLARKREMGHKIKPAIEAKEKAT